MKDFKMLSLLVLLITMLHITSATTFATEKSASSVNITGKGPIGIEIVKTNSSSVSFEMLGVEDESAVTTSASEKNGILDIKVSSTGNNSIISLGGTDANGDPSYMNVVRVYVPDVSYSSFNILSSGLSNYLYVRMEDFTVPTGVKIDIKDGTFILKDKTISRSNYDIKVDAGSLTIDADTVTTNINANLVRGGSLGFHLSKQPSNMYVDSSGLKPFVYRPDGWGPFYTVGNGTPKIVLTSGGGVSSIKVGK